MAKGIRQFVESRFTKYLPKLQDMGGTGFRRKVLDETVAQFDITMASASAAYNYVINKFRQEQPKAVAGLGRTEQGTNVLGRVSMTAANRRSSDIKRTPKAKAVGNVSLVRVRDGETVVDSIPRSLAQELVESSGGRGRGNAKLAIAEDMQ